MENKAGGSNERSTHGSTRRTRRSQSRRQLGVEEHARGAVPDIDPRLDTFAFQLFGNGLYSRPIAAVAPAAPKSSKIEGEAAERALAHPEVQRFQELFPGAQVRAVRNLKESQ